MRTIILSFDKNNAFHYRYQQIYEELKKHILNRKLKANEKLPSKRKLAEQLHVSVNTVTNAYEQLLAEGYIYTKERKGYFVENITQFVHKKAAINTLPKDLKENNSSEEGWISLSHMTSDISIFPFNEWLKCQQMAIKNHKRELSEISHPQGPYEIRETIADMIALSRGVICEPEQIIIGAGTQLLVRQLMDMAESDAVIAMEDPGYPRIYTLLKNMGFDVRALPLDEEGISMEKIERSKINFLFVTPSHQFPTGKIMPISRRIALLNWSMQASDRYIIEDDYDSEFKYETDNIPSLQSFDRHQRVIYTGTFSKTILPGLRVSYMVLPPDMLRKYQKHQIHLMQSSNSLALYTLYYFIETDGYARHIKRMNHHYKMKRKELIKQLQNRFGKSVTIEDIPAGLHFLAEFKTKKAYESVVERAQKEKLEIYSLRRFVLENKLKEENSIQLIIGFANIKIEQIPEAVERLYQVIY